MDIIFNFNTVAAEQSSYWQVWVGVILTAVGAISAAVNSYFARQLHAETKRLREAQIDPKLIMYVYQKKADKNTSDYRKDIYMLRIKNIGHSIAMDIGLECNHPDITKYNKTLFSKKFSLSPEQELDFEFYDGENDRLGVLFPTTFGYSDDDIKNLPTIAGVTVTARYFSETNRQRELTTPLCVNFSVIPNIVPQR
ncbi:hypothetical protein [Desulfarculus baarsii]|uniref:hypothetical protein n=1 Tax=Desulfarculus baarsii TaxID=453230 RepID=UPI0011D11090|nr:hypothetical protein [Desulfarculus baarsii]